MKDYLIEIVEYDSDWPELYKQEKERLSEAIYCHRAVFEHIGSTAIPNLSAKPIIDISIGIDDFSIVDQVVKQIEQIGYTYEPSLEAFLPDMKFLWKGKPSSETHDLHEVHVGIRPVKSEDWKNTLLFRDYLLKHPNIAEVYAELKTLVAKQFGEDHGRYNYEKTSFVKAVVSVAQKSL